MTEREMVEEFHRAMGRPVRTTPTMPSEAERVMRCRLLLEEVLEVIQASGCVVKFLDDDRMTAVSMPEAGTPPLASMAHELNDLLYVAYGGLAEAGVPLSVFAEIHCANMSKLGGDGRPVLRADGKVMKGPNYRPPDVAGVLARAESRCPRCGCAQHCQHGTNGTAPHSYCSSRDGWNSPNCACDYMPVAP